MSYTTLYKIPTSGEIEVVAEYKNSHLWAIFVWRALARSYLNWSDDAFALHRDLQPIWDLYKEPPYKVADYVRIVLMATFDYAIFKQEDLQALADALEKFDRMWPGSHCAAMAQDVRGLVGGEDVAGVCWQTTSVCSDFWWNYKTERAVTLEEINSGAIEKAWAYSSKMQYWSPDADLGDHNLPVEAK